MENINPGVIIICSVLLILACACVAALVYTIAQAEGWVEDEEYQRYMYGVTRKEYEKLNPSK